MKKIRLATKLPNDPENTTGIPISKNPVLAQVIKLVVIVVLVTVIPNVVNKLVLVVVVDMIKLELASGPVWAVKVPLAVAKANTPPPLEVLIVKVVLDAADSTK